MTNLLYLALGGILGTLGRYFLGGTVYKALGHQVPYGTFVVNLLGCFILGLFVAFNARKLSLDPHLQLFIIVGFCGAFTTFSTFAMDAYQLFTTEQSLKAFGYILGSVILGLATFRLGTLLGELF